MQVLLDVVRGGEGTGRLNGREDQVEVAFCVSEVGGLVLTCMLNYSLYERYEYGMHARMWGTLRA